MSLSSMLSDITTRQVLERLMKQPNHSWHSITYLKQYFQFHRLTYHIYCTYRGRYSIVKWDANIHKHEFLTTSNKPNKNENMGEFLKKFNSPLTFAFSSFMHVKIFTRVLFESNYSITSTLILEHQSKKSLFIKHTINY